MSRSYFKTATNNIIFFIIFLFSKLPYKPTLGVLRTLAVLIWSADRFHRNMAKAQMQAAIGENYRRGMTLKVFMRHADILIDTIRLAFMSDEQIKASVQVSGFEYLEKAKATGRGVMLVSGHIGNWEILTHIPRIIGTEFCVMANIRNNELIEDLIHGLRKRSGATILPPKGKARMLIHELQHGRTIGFMIDNRGHGSSRIFCPIFGMPASTNPAPAFFAYKGDAIIVPVFAVKENGKHHIQFEKPLDNRDYPNGDIQQLSNDMQAWVESVVSRYPLQWFWLYSRWITRSKMRRIILDNADFKTAVFELNSPS